MSDTPERRQTGIPDRRRGTLEALESHVDEHIEKIEHRLSKWLIRGLVAYAVIAVACVVALVGFGIALDQIQDTRKEFVKANCEAQNKRHDQTISKFKEISQEAIKKHPEQAEQIKAAREPNTQIIDVLAPKQDCEALSKVAVGEEAPPPPTTTKESP